MHLNREENSKGEQIPYQLISGSHALSPFSCTLSRWFQNALEYDLLSNVAGGHCHTLGDIAYFHCHCDHISMVNL